jgi:hypothetical protein
MTFLLYLTEFNHLHQQKLREEHFEPLSTWSSKWMVHSDRAICPMTVKPQPSYFRDDSIRLEPQPSYFSVDPGRILISSMPPSMQSFETILFYDPIITFETYHD